MVIEMRLFSINRKKINDSYNQFGWSRFQIALDGKEHIFGHNPPMFRGRPGQVVSGFVQEKLTIPPHEYIWTWIDGRGWFLSRKYIYTDRDMLHINIDQILFAVLLFLCSVISLSMFLGFVFLITGTYR